MSNLEKKPTSRRRRTSDPLPPESTDDARPAPGDADSPDAPPQPDRPLAAPPPEDALTPRPRPTPENLPISDADELRTDSLADSAPAEPQDAVLGTLSTGAKRPGSVDRAASGESVPSNAPPPKRSFRKKESRPAQSPGPSVLGAGQDRPTEAPPAGAPPPPEQASEEPLRLPRGAFLALRKSGGLHFTSRTVVLYPDGRVAYDLRAVPQKEYNRLRRVLNDGQIQSLRKLLDQTGFWRAETTGKQNPDAYAYEVAARLGQRANAIELYDGSVPDRLSPLLERLAALLPSDAEPAEA